MFRRLLLPVRPMVAPLAVMVAPLEPMVASLRRMGEFANGAPLTPPTPTLVPLAPEYFSWFLALGAAVAG